MPDYAYGRIRALDTALRRAKLPGETCARILEGGDSLAESSPPPVRAAWMAAAMQRMDTLLDEPTRRAVRERCACCLEGKRGQLSRQIGRDRATLEERVAAANETRLVFGHGVSLHPGGEVLVQFQPAGHGPYRCPCQPGATSPMSITYCLCCGGHVRHHLRRALACDLEITVKSSALSSGGANPCTFLARITGQGD